MMDIRFLIAGIVLCAAFSTSAEAKLYKWVDDNGVTHYSETMPPKYATRNRVQLDDQGREVKDDKKDKRVNKADSQPTPEEQAAIDQRRKDKALLDTYSNESEIDLARDRNLQQANARINSINIRLKSAQSNLAGHRKESAGFIKAGKKIPPSLQSDLADDQDKIDSLQGQLNQAQKEADAIKARYDADKVRYRELTGR